MKNVSITGKALRVTIASFFVANIMTVIGSVIDGFVIGNAMDESAAAAVGLVSPLVILFAVIGTTTGISFQDRSLRRLSRGDTAAAGRALIETLTLGLLLSVIVMILTLHWTESIVTSIGVPDGSNSAGPCADYLRGIAFGVPAMTAMAIMSRGPLIDGDSRIAVAAVIVMAAFNILLDVVCVNYSDAGMFEIALGTSFSYYAGTAVLVWYYRKPDVLIKPGVKGASLRETLKVNHAGVWGGILAAVFAVTMVLRADVLNFAMELFRVGDAGLQAYNVQVQVNYIVSTFQNSAISALFLLSALCRNEEDREGFKKTTSGIVKYDIISVAAISIALFVFANGIAALYLGSVSDEVMASAAGALRACAIGLVFQMIALLFANYIQLFGHYIVSAIIIIFVNFIAPLFGAAYGGVVAKAISGDPVVGVFGGVSVCSILVTLVVIPILIPIISRGLRGKDRLWVMPAGFGVSPEDELRETIASEQAVMEFRDRVLDFCGEKGVSEKISFLAALTVEEVAMNIVQHGFMRDDKDHILEIRLVYKEGELILRFRDDCPNFDPRKQYETIFRNNDVSRMIGTRMIIAKAKDVSYTSMLDLNNLIICIEANGN